MNAACHQPAAVASRELVQVIEPLADYICAAERPLETLVSALATLLAEVEGTNLAALAHFSRLHGEALGLAS
jgi:hypothetical protein